MMNKIISRLVEKSDAFQDFNDLMKINCSDASIQNIQTFEEDWADCHSR